MQGGEAPLHNSEKNNSNFMGCMINGNSGNGSNAGSAYVNANNTLGNANANIAACNLATAPMASAKDFLALVHRPKALQRKQPQPIG